MQPTQQLSSDDVAYLVNLHSGFVGVPPTLHAALCTKLVNGVLDAGASFYISEDQGTRPQARALVELSVEGDVWICEHACRFSTREELLRLVHQEGDDPERTRPLHEVAALAPGADASSVTNNLLREHSHLLPAGADSDNGSHFICDRFGAAFGAAILGHAPTCCTVTIFSPLHGRHFNVFWVTVALKVNDACTVRRDEGCYFANSKGGNAHLHRVASPHYRKLFNLDRGSFESSAVLTTDATNLINLSPDPLRPVLLCEEFLRPQELAYLTGLIYGSDEDSFGTQFVKGSATVTELATTENGHCGLELEQELLDADTMALVAAALGERNASGATKNRLRTSHFLRTVWWRSGQGRDIFEAISARAAALLGLPPASAEAPQIVCYPGGLSYFRPHHDSGRLLAEGQRDDCCSEVGSTSSDDEGSDCPSSSPSPSALVNLDRDQHGAARIATAFVYLSSHEPGSGGSTTFSHLQLPTDTTSKETVAPPLKVAPIAGAAALWSNVDGDGCPDPCMVHEAEALNYPSMVSMEAALADQTLPMKMGLNLWFTDRDPYPRPEMESGGVALAYLAQDLQAGASCNCDEGDDSSDGD